MTNLRIGVPSKGRLAEIAGELLKEAGLSFRRPERSLFARCREMPIDMTFLRTEDIPVLCSEGAIDMGITGSDLVAEHGQKDLCRLALGVGHCRLAVCVAEDSHFNKRADLSGARIATSFPHSTRSFLANNGLDPNRIVTLSGSVEIMITLGIADAIVDLIETGSTLAANRLRVLAVISQHEAVLIQNYSLEHGEHAELANRVARRLEGVVIARNYSLLEYNIPRAKLAEAETITPGFESPTVSALEDPDWCAVRVMAKRDEVIAIMERLETLGASAILETRITNCRL